MDRARPPCDGGNLVTTLVYTSLPSAQERTATGKISGGAVVGEEEDECFPLDSELDENPAKLSDSFVDGQGHPLVFFDPLLRGNFAPLPAIPFLRGSSYRIAGHLHGVVNRLVGDVEAEGLLRRSVAADEVVRVPVDEVGAVAFFTGLLAAVPPVVNVVVTDVTDEVDVAAVVTDEFVEAVVLGMIVVGVDRIPLVPLPDQAGSGRAESKVT